MASLVSYGACQSACNAGVVVCYSSAGLIFGAANGGAALLAEGSAETAATGGWMGPVVAIGGTILTAWMMLG